MCIHARNLVLHMHRHACIVHVYVCTCVCIISHARMRNKVFSELHDSGKVEDRLLHRGNHSAVLEKVPLASARQRAQVCEQQKRPLYSRKRAYEKQKRPTYKGDLDAQETYY